MAEARVLVVGAGIAGLAAAVELVDTPGIDVEVWEAAGRPGGKIATSAFAGVDHVDEGADAYLTRVPHAVGLAAKVGLRHDDLTAPTDARAAIWHDGLHAVPDGILLGVPAAIRPFVTTRLLSPRGKLRAAVEPLLPRTAPDDSIGALVRARFGREVHERLVDALVGSIYATDTDRSSLAAVPQLAELARHRSLLIGAIAARRRRPRTTGAPIFGAPRSGMAALVDAAGRYITSRGGVVCPSRPATTLTHDGAGWRVDDERFDAVVLAAPARATATLITPVLGEVASLLERFETADVIMVRLAVGGAAWPERLHGRSGYLVPKSEQRHVTAASFGSQKWAHWRPCDGGQVLRVSLGRDGLPVRHLDDAAVLDATLDEVGRHLDLDLQPTATSISRWLGAFPQYRPHHQRLATAVDAALPATVAAAGASYRGIGIPACVADGERAARRVAAALGASDSSKLKSPTRRADDVLP